ncbi:MAG TPA: hypothetical protein VGM20_04970 [Gemmatimonadales bacterium]
MVDRYLWTPAAAAVFALIATVLATLLYDRMKRRITVTYICRPQRALVDEIHSLYLQRIEANERVSPEYLTHCLNGARDCVTSGQDLFNLDRRSDLPEVMHLLLAARYQGEVVGMAKAIFVASASVLFIAYVAVQPGVASVERRAMRLLLAAMAKVARSDGPVRWVAFELTNTDVKVTHAKGRLFRHHARSLGIDLKRVQFEYLQPDLDCVALDKCEEVPAELYVAAIDGTPTAIPLPELWAIMRGIMVNIYVASWLIDHSATDRPALETYVLDLTKLMLDGLPDPVPLI